MTPLHLLASAFLAKVRGALARMAFVPLAIVLPLLSSWHLAADGRQAPLVLVMGEDSYPYQFVDENGDAKGVLVDLWREWSSQTQVPVVFVARHWQDSLKQLAQGDADIHIGLGITKERDRDFDFAAPIAYVSTYLYVRNTLKGKKSFTDLQPYRIGVVAGSSHESILNHQVNGLSYRYYNSRAELLRAVVAGEVDVFAGMEGYLKDNAVSRAVLEEFPLDNRLLIKKTALVPAVSKGRLDLITEINRGFDSLSQTSRAEIDKRWLGFSRDANTLVIATTTGIQPFVDTGGDGEPHGLYIDIWKLWSKKTGIEVEFRPAAMEDGLDELRFHRADIHVGYPESDTMKSNLTRAWRTYQVKSRLFSYGKAINSLDELKGKRVGAVPTAPYLDKLKQALPNSELKLYTDVTQMIQAAQQGHIAAFVASSAWTQHYLLRAESWSDFHQFRALAFTTDIYALTRNEDKGLAQRIAAGFRLISNAELASIENKWILDRDDRSVQSLLNPLSITESQRRYLDGLGTLKVGYLAAWAPMEFQGPSGEFMGINSEISLWVADQLGLTIEGVPFERWSSLLDALKQGEIDIVGSVAHTPEREREMVFTSPYWPSPWGLVTNLSQVTVFNLSQMSGKRLAIVEGYHLIANLMNKALGIELVIVPNSRAGVDAVAQGKADAFIEKVINMAMVLKESDYKALKMSVLADFSQQQSHFALNPKYKELVPLWDQAIAQLTPERQEEIYQHWVKEEVSNWRAWVNYQSAFYLLALLSFVVFVYLILRSQRSRLAAAKELAHELTRAGQFDTLTGLPNRSLLDDRLQQSVLLHRREMQPFAVLFISFDNMRQINQTFGHQVGDRVLAEGAQRLKSAVRKSDTLARFGGNEFVMVLNRSKDLDTVCQVADGIVGGFSAPFAINGLDVALSVSIGVAMFPNDGDTVVELLKTADKLMSRAVKQGGRCYQSA
ncbi:transporter substrate-binding domain-containing protein [Shewanella sp. Isolate8]|uniref:transporter substrate-binding domain-containing protein n=1 Tax=Shewanella sp. Isolate8 TaxID=2908529 RepID=UPI001EFE77FF|nr:transporter substrate-binding domain-containing protein [Shewanella sp. Isolate8]MCG9746594.1 transporter substrate-binding domain-containing protein [Shewanella sp. Isolate8]